MVSVVPPDVKGSVKTFSGAVEFPTHEIVLRVVTHDEESAQAGCTNTNASKPNSNA
jgi:hypothetical protein